MAKAADEPTTATWIPLREVVARAGDVEAVRAALIEGRVVARATTFLPAGGKVPDVIDPIWWTDAKIYTVASRAIFKMALANFGDTTVTYELTAIGVELEPDAVEGLWPKVETPAATKPLPIPPTGAPTPSPKQGRKAGTKPKFDWDAIQAHCHQCFNDNGIPENVSAFCRDEIIPWCGEWFGEDGTPDMETLRPLVTKWIAAWQRSLLPE